MSLNKENIRKLRESMKQFKVEPTHVIVPICCEQAMTWKEDQFECLKCGSKAEYYVEDD